MQARAAHYVLSHLRRFGRVIGPKRSIPLSQAKQSLLVDMSAPTLRVVSLNFLAVSVSSKHMVSGLLKF